jgi:putative PIG3 family NAD(P)H quinone oxidoreductase
VNRADLLQLRGLYPPPPGASEILGLEAAGTVDQVGLGVEGWQVGDAAMVLLAGGGHAERVVADARHLLPVPASVGLPDAGAVPEVFLTAWSNLVELGGLRARERVLVQGGSGGVGTAAIQLARWLGAEVWVTAGGPDRCARCLALGAHAAFDHRDPTLDLGAELERRGGVDLVLDVLGARALGAHLRALRPEGRLVVIGLQGGRRAELDLSALLAKRLRIIGSTLRGRSADEKAALVARFRAGALPAFDTGALRPVIGLRVGWTDLRAAHACLDASGVFGKILVTVG